MDINRILSLYYIVTVKLHYILSHDPTVTCFQKKKKNTQESGKSLEFRLTTCKSSIVTQKHPLEPNSRQEKRAPFLTQVPSGFPIINIVVNHSQKGFHLPSPLHASRALS